MDDVLVTAGVVRPGVEVFGARAWFVAGRDEARSERAILIARRRPERRHGGAWEFPGGKIEAGETPENCLRRELFEELGIDVEVGGHVMTVRHDYGPGLGVVVLMAYEARVVGGAWTPKDHDALAWVEASELFDFALAEADLPIAKALVESARS